MSYLAWQFLRGPRWLIEFSWNLQRVLFRLFSVPLMIRTLFQHWRRDIVTYRGTIGERLQILLLNLVSRAAGFIIRTSLLFAWLVAAFLLIPISFIALLLFFLWPIVAIALMFVGVSLIAITL